MIRNFEDLLEGGFISEDGQFLRPLTFKDLTGMDFGVLFDYSGDEDMENFAIAGNLGSIELVGKIEIPLPGLPMGDWYYPWIVGLDVEENADKTIQDWEYPIMRRCGTPEKDIETLKHVKGTGCFIQIRVRFMEGHTGSICVYAPYEWKEKGGCNEN